MSTCIEGPPADENASLAANSNFSKNQNTAGL
jgi:hypothetical protein